MRGHLFDWKGIKLIAFKLITWARLIRPLFRLLIFIIIDKQLIGGLPDYLKTYYCEVHLLHYILLLLFFFIIFDKQLKVDEADAAFVLQFEW